ncbi:MAG TPA: hypothetical protein VKF59_15045 [Candidatus Dormibacteraeota bacterium]|nr:hypothetical protein [Candidatus Dormibacteraeota bacterium]
MGREERPDRPPARDLPADLEVLSWPGHGRTRWRECPACGSHELRPSEGPVREPSPDVVCSGCGVGFRVHPDGTLVAVR